MAEKTQEEYNAELDELVDNFQETERTKADYEAAASAGLAAIIAYQFQLGKCIPYPPGILGPIKALPDFVIETLGGKEILDQLEEPEKVVTDQIAKMMSFIQLIISFASGGLFPPLPNLDIVKLYLEFLQRLNDSGTQDDEQNLDQSDSGTVSGSGFGSGSGSEDSGNLF